MYVLQWCTYEWSCAIELGVPMKCVIDMQRFSKDGIITGLRHADFEQLLTYQCVEYTERNRRACITELSSFLQEQCDQLLPEEEKTLSVEEDLLVGQTAQMLLHPAADFMLLLCG